MFELFIILKDIILPIFIIMGIGFFMEKMFDLDVQTLARLNIYFLVPGFIFVKLYSIHFSAHLFITILLFLSLYIIIQYSLAALMSKWLGLGKGKEITFTNSVMFFNSGNYGVPVNDLVFKSDPLAMSVQVIVLTLQNIFLFSYGIFYLQSIHVGKLKAMVGYFKMPVLYAMLAGILLNIFAVPIPSFLWMPANYIADAMIALTLFTLGAQVAKIRFMTGLATVYISLIARLLIGPLIALGIIFIFQIEGIVAKALLIASAMPTSASSAIIAQEYKNHPNLASQIVLYSTLFSACTVTLVIYLTRVLL